MRRQFGAIAVLSTAAAVLSLAGCGGSSTPTGTSGQVTNFNSLPAADQQSLGQSVAEEVTADVGAFTSLDPYSSLIFNRVGTHHVNAVRVLANNAPRVRPLQSDTGCTDTETPADPTYSPAGIPDTLSIVYDCTTTSSGETITIADTIDIGDPNPNADAIDYDAGFDLNITESGGTDGNVNLAYNGTIAVTENGNTIGLTGSASLASQLSNEPDGDNGTVTINANETASYTYQGATVTNFEQLSGDAGVYTLSGNWTYAVALTKLNGNLSFTVATQSGGLQINPSTCTANGASIVSGTVVATFTGGGTVTIVWSGCPATPSVTVS
jgi:hypothetical protein